MRIFGRYNIHRREIMRKEDLVMIFMIIAIILATLWITQSDVLESGNDELKKYEVYGIDNEVIGNKNITIVYQIKNNISSKFPYDIDPQSKIEITYITWYIFHNYNNTDELQIICYYNNSSKLTEYYKFRIDRRDAKLSGILNVSKEELKLNIKYYYRKLIKLGILKIKDGNVIYWRRVDYAYNYTD